LLDQLIEQETGIAVGLRPPRPSGAPQRGDFASMFAISLI
jgi:hypothetical protein